MIFTRHKLASDIMETKATGRFPVLQGSVDDVSNTPIKFRQFRNDDEIVLNVGGIRHETHVSTLRNVPNTRLSRLAESHVQSNGAKDEYFFDRHPAVFNSVIDFYRTGELHVPLEVCGAVVKRELDFWQMNESEIKACCWRHYRSYIENQRILDSFDNSLKKEQFSVDLDTMTGWKRFQMKIWLILDHPRTSRTAMVYGITSFLFVISSIAGFCLETIPDLRPRVIRNVTTTCDGDTSNNISVVMASHEALNVLDIICTIFFTLELISRFIFAPDKLSFIKSIMNIMDLLALIPLYVQVIFEHSSLQACYLNERLVIEILFILRIIRMFRVFHLVKHYQALKVLVYSLKASLHELLMLLIFLMIGMLVFATMIYYTERKDAVNPSDTFNTIPVGFWWAIITMTTVGYGDKYPSTPVGYVVGTACAVSGVLLLALTFPVISNNFTLFYHHVRSRSALPRNRNTLFSPELASNEKEVSNEIPQPILRSNMGEKSCKNSSDILNIKDADLTEHSKQQKSGFETVARYSETTSLTDVILDKDESEYSLCRNGSVKARSLDEEIYNLEASL